METIPSLGSATNKQSDQMLSMFSKQHPREELEQVSTRDSSSKSATCTRSQYDDLETTEVRRPVGRGVHVHPLLD